ncbi:transcriptional regulator [Micromonospora wenchangensis]|uniref:Transcriptional regulator n=1 Tax=Micromonospora wenchangensis TaxID=1185415 RepID=A0A246RNU9_9ACTN|nr:helix-turn-helix transcriptional regulator [Micromonospora wenchangensis]OWV08888.1 transcriptional regulator [Micromonospora wenchangensis]
MARSWRDTRSRIDLDEAKVTEHKERMLAEVRATRLREVRERRGLSQKDVAERMDVSQPRVAAIEKGEVPATEVGTIQRYVSALGGKLELVADFDGERLALG